MGQGKELSKDRFQEKFRVLKSELYQRIAPSLRQGGWAVIPHIYQSMTIVLQHPRALNIHVEDLPCL